MPVFVQGNGFPLSDEEVAGLWRETKGVSQYREGEITVRCVGKKEMRRLNREYGGKDEATNVLTFSYGEEHDVALCLEVARQEASWSGGELKDYVAWLLVHAFLHVTGMDHEGTGEEAGRMEELEKVILKERGFLA